MLLSAKKASIVLLILLLPISGCAKEINHSDYVKAFLDAFYKGDFSAYATLMEITDEEVKKGYDVNIKYLTEDICQSLGASVADDTKDELNSVFARMLKEASYLVTASEKVSSTEYNVELKILPITNLLNMDETLSGLTARFMDNAAARRLGEPDYEGLQQQFLEELTAAIAESTSTIEYGEEKIISAVLEYNKDAKNWQITKESQQEIFETVVAVNP